MPGASCWPSSSTTDRGRSRATYPSDRHRFYDWGSAEGLGLCEIKFIQNLTIFGPYLAQACEIESGSSSRPTPMSDSPQASGSHSRRACSSGPRPAGRYRVSMDPALNVENSQSGLPDWATGAGVAGDPVEDPVNSNLQFIDGQAGRLIHKLADSLNEHIVFSATVQESAGDSARYFVRLYNASGALLHSTVNLATGRADLQTREVQLDLSSPPLNAATSLELEVEDGFLAVFHTSVTREVSSQSAALYSDAPETPPGTSFSVKNGAGKLTAFLDKTGQSAFSYDRRGRLVAERRSLGGSGKSPATYNRRPARHDGLPQRGAPLVSVHPARAWELQTDRSTANFSSPWLRLVHDIQYDLDEFGELDEVQFGENEKFRRLYPPPTSIRRWTVV